MKCPYCGSPNVERMKEWDMPKMGYHVVHYVCRSCGGRFNHYVGKGEGVRAEGGLQGAEVSL